MNKDYFLNHELIDDDPLLHFAFYGLNNLNHKTQQQTDEANQKTIKLIFKKMMQNE